jgi:hypothetical protein
VIHTYDTLKRVLIALEKSGYVCEDDTGSRDIHAAVFVGWNEQGDEVHTIWFENGDGREEQGRVYIDAQGKGEF